MSALPSRYASSSSMLNLPSTTTSSSSTVAPLSRSSHRLAQPAPSQRSTNTSSQLAPPSKSTNTSTRPVVPSKSINATSQPTFPPSPTNAPSELPFDARDTQSDSLYVLLQLCHSVFHAYFVLRYPDTSSMQGYQYGETTSGENTNDWSRHSFETPRASATSAQYTATHSEIQQPRLRSLHNGPSTHSTINEEIEGQQHTHSLVSRPSTHSPHDHAGDMPTEDSFIPSFDDDHGNIDPSLLAATPADTRPAPVAHASENAILRQIGVTLSDHR